MHGNSSGSVKRSVKHWIVPGASAHAGYQCIGALAARETDPIMLFSPHFQSDIDSFSGQQYRSVTGVRQRPF